MQWKSADELETGGEKTRDTRAGVDGEGTKVLANCDGTSPKLTSAHALITLNVLFGSQIYDAVYVISKWHIFKCMSPCSENYPPNTPWG